FLRTQIAMIAYYFAAGEVDEIWITFPDPQLRTSKAKKRLTHPQFLRLYQQVLKTGGSIHLKTDSPNLHVFTSKIISMYGLILKEESGNVYAEAHKPELDIKTHYEELDIAQSKKIHYLHFALPPSLPDRDNELMENLKQTENQHDQG
ncbi:MAG: tRNA (guanosine(46)-N7)-methyltransferase TrmB, partial [Rhizobacter sp.]|nr:tRNA (guanosine(46)-N7)-methyltransferase TrmB [Ferruginibacter sp.]